MNKDELKEILNDSTLLEVEVEYLADKLETFLAPELEKAKKWDRVKDLNLYPRIAEAYKRAIIRAYDSRERPSKGIKSGEDMFDWWISGRSAKEWAAKDTSFWAYE